jgi:hypothetical protein
MRLLGSGPSGAAWANWSGLAAQEDKASYILRKVRDAGIVVPVGILVPSARDGCANLLEKAEQRQQQQRIDLVGDGRLHCASGCVIRSLSPGLARLPGQLMLRLLPSPSRVQDTSVDDEAQKRGEEYFGTFISPQQQQHRMRKGRTLPAAALRSSGYNNSNRRYERRAEPSKPLGTRPSRTREVPWSALPPYANPRHERITGKQMAGWRSVSAGNDVVAAPSRQEMESSQQYRQDVGHDREKELLQMTVRNLELPL